MGSGHPPPSSHPRRLEAVLTPVSREPASDPLHIIHVLAPGPVGGLERVVQQLARSQHQGGLRVDVVAILDADDGGDAFLGPLRSSGVPVTPVRLPPRAYVAERRRLGAVLALRRPDLVHTHGYRADIQGGGVARRLGVPTVTTVHGFTGGDWKNRLYERLQLRAFRRADAVVAVSAPLVTRLRAAGISGDRLHLVPNAAPTDEPPLPRGEARRRLGVPEQGVVVGWVGRLSLEKGPDVFLRALAALDDPGVRGIVIGSGREGAALATLARRLGVEGRVIWSGRVPEAGRLFAAFDCFVLSSRTEGTPIVLFEAMAAEVPIVATSVGGVPDVVSSLEASLVPADDAGGLAAAIRDVLTNPAAAQARAGRARGRLERERVLAPWVARYEHIYGMVIGRRRPTP